MENDNNVFGMFHGITVFSVILVLFFSPILFGFVSISKGELETETKSRFDLSVDENLVTLHANNASLYQIIEELGKLMKIEVVGNIHEEEQVNADFVKLSLIEALDQLSTNYGYQMDSDNDGDENFDRPSRITKIIILPKGREKGLSKIASKDTVIQENQNEEPKRPEPFKFEFDPSKYMDGEAK